MPLLVIVVIIVIALLATRRPAPMEFVVTIEPARPAGFGCMPMLLLAVLLVLALTTR